MTSCMRRASSRDKFLIEDMDFISPIQHSYRIDDFLSPFPNSDGTDDGFGVGEVR